MRQHVTIYASRHNTDTTSGEPTRCNVADMVCVVSATWHRHVGMSVVLGEKNPRHDADITSQVMTNRTNDDPLPNTAARLTCWVRLLNTTAAGNSGQSAREQHASWVLLFSNANTLPTQASPPRIRSLHRQHDSPMQFKEPTPPTSTIQHSNRSTTFRKFSMRPWKAVSHFNARTRPQQDTIHPSKHQSRRCPTCPALQHNPRANLQGCYPFATHCYQAHWHGTHQAHQHGTHYRLVKKLFPKPTTPTRLTQPRRSQRLADLENPAPNDDAPAANTHSWAQAHTITQEAILACISTHRDITTCRLTASNAARRQFPAEILNAVLDKNTGELMEMSHLLINPKYKEVWGKSYTTKLGQLAQGIPGVSKGPSCSSNKTKSPSTVSEMLHMDVCV